MAIDRSSLGRVEATMLQPAAQPTDTFVTAAQPERSNLGELGEALSGLSETLFAEAERRKAEQAKKDAILGEAAFYKANGQGYDEAVRAGLIPAQASPSFVKAFKEAEGANVGIKLSTKFFADYNAWEGKNGTDSAAFDQFFQTWLAENITSNDPEVLAGLVPQVRQLANAAEGQWNKDLDENLYKGLARETAVQFNTTIDAAALTGAGSPEGIDTAGLWTQLDQQFGLANGKLREEDATTLLIDAITTKARTADSYEEGMAILKLLDNVPTGMEYSLAALPYGAEQQRITAEALDTDLRQERSDANAAAVEQRRVDLWSAWDQAFEFMLKNRGAPIPEEILKLGQKGDPNFRTDIVTAQKTFLAGGAIEDPAAVNQLYKDILEAGAKGGMQLVSEAFRDGIISDPSTLRTALDFAKGLAGDNTVMRDIRQGTTYTTTVDGIKAGLSSGPLDIGNPFANPQIAGAVGDYNLALTMWAMNHPNATPEEIERAQQVIGQQILQGIQGTSEGFRGGTYQRPPGMEETLGPSPAFPAQTQPQGGNAGQAPQQPQQGAVAPPAQPGPPVGANGQELQTISRQQRELFRESLSPEDEVLIEQEAARYGVTVDEMLDAVIRQKMSQPEGDVAPDNTSLRGNGNATAPRDTPAAPDSSGQSVASNELLGEDDPRAEAIRSVVPGATPEQIVTGAAELRAQAPQGDAPANIPEAAFMNQQQGDGEGAAWSPSEAIPDAQNNPTAISIVEDFLKEKGLSDLPDLTDGNAVMSWLGTKLRGAGISAWAPGGDLLGDLAIQGGTTLEVAQRFLGVDERKSEDVKALDAFFRRYAGKAWGKNSVASTAWCAAFVNAVLGASGQDGTGSLMARSFLDWGKDVAPDKAAAGDVIVFPRGKPPSGHVGIIVAIDYENDTVEVMGGNQSTRDSGSQGVTVNTKTFRLSSALGIRRAQKLKDGDVLVASN